jgi:hypothetical protein
MNLVKFQVWCDTESKYEYIWLPETDPAPSVCPANNTHSIDATKNSIVESVKSDEVKVINKPIVASEKTSNYSKTHISHNFCDDSTWEVPGDSSWTLEAPTGQKYIIVKAEVQFSHDVKLATMTTPNEFYYDFWAGGAKIDSESHLINSIGKIFDLGNRHYTMNATVDGIGGMTTVEFDYSDLIVLESSMLKKIILSLKDDNKMDGTHCTVSFVVRPEAE